MVSIRSMQDPYIDDYFDDEDEEAREYAEDRAADEYYERVTAERDGFEL